MSSILIPDSGSIPSQASRSRRFRIVECSVEHTIKRLPNGVNLVVLQNPYLHSMVAMVGVKFGSRYEPKEMRGAAHFIEHMMFKGSKNHPSSKALSEIIDACGGEHNAFTDKEETTFHIRLAKEKGSLAVQLVHDMISSPLFRSSDVEMERSVIREEISDYDNSPDQNAWELSEIQAFKGSGLEHPIAGSIKSVGFSATNLRKFFYRHYTPSRMTVALAGAVDDIAIRAAEERFGSMTEPCYDQTPGFELLKKEPEPGFIFRSGNTDKIHLIFRLPGTHYGSENSRVTDTISAVLGGFMSARLFQALRDKKGLCYSVWSMPHRYSETGSLIIGLTVDKKNLSPALETMSKELVKMVKKGVTAKELQTVKTHIQGSRAMVMDNPMGMAQDAVTQIFMTGKYETSEQDLAKYMAISLDEVNEEARRTLIPSLGHLAAVGSVKSLNAVKRAYESSLQ